MYRNLPFHQTHLSLSIPNNLFERGDISWRKWRKCHLLIYWVALKKTFQNSKVLIECFSVLYVLFWLINSCAEISFNGKTCSGSGKLLVLGRHKLIQVIFLVCYVHLKHLSQKHLSQIYVFSNWTMLASQMLNIFVLTIGYI